MSGIPALPFIIKNKENGVIEIRKWILNFAHLIKSVLPVTTVHCSEADCTLKNKKLWAPMTTNVDTP